MGTSRITAWTLTTVLALVAPGGPVLAETGTEPLALRTIMQNLGKNMQAITDGISREDWELVAKIAPLIADHPQPPLVEKVRILSFVGSHAAKFKGYDEKSRHAAQSLRQAATRQDGPVVVSEFATLQNSCLACHQSFRMPFKEHFYDQY